MTLTTITATETSMLTGMTPTELRTELDHAQEQGDTALVIALTAELAEREGALSWWVVREGVVVARYATVGQARRAVDRRDARYGAAVHSYVHASWSAR